MHLVDSKNSGRSVHVEMNEASNDILDIGTTSFFNTGRKGQDTARCAWLLNIRQANFRMLNRKN